LEYRIVSTVARLFKLTVNNPAGHSGPLAAIRLAPKNNHPSHDEADVDVDDEAAHGPTSIAMGNITGIVDPETFRIP
jgi:hypothetical protein